MLEAQFDIMDPYTEKKSRNRQYMIIITIIGTGTFIIFIFLHSFVHHSITSKNQYNNNNNNNTILHYSIYRVFCFCFLSINRIMDFNKWIWIEERRDENVKENREKMKQANRFPS